MIAIAALNAGQVKLLPDGVSFNAARLRVHPHIAGFCTLATILTLGSTKIARFPDASQGMALRPFAPSRRAKGERNPRRYRMPLNYSLAFPSAHHDDVGEVHFWPVDLDPEIAFGHIKYERDRSSPYEDEFTVANIRFDKNLTRCWRRFVCCKELMHVFDSAAERVDTREKFLRLMGEFEAIPISEDVSPMFLSELRAQWMALMVLCPKRLRDKYIIGWRDKSLTDYDLALKIKIPELAIKALMSDHYETGLARLIAEAPTNPQ